MLQFHLGRACKTPCRERLDPAAADLFAMLNTPCFLLADDGSVLHANPAARALTDGEGPLRVRGARLSSDDRAIALSVRGLIERLSGGTANGLTNEVTIRWPGASQPLLLVGLRLAEPEADLALDQRVAAAVFVFRSDRPLDQGAMRRRLRALFALTGAETEVVERLLAGQSARAIARARGVSELTVRTQVRSILDKTGLHRQAELACLLELTRVATPPSVGGL